MIAPLSTVDLHAHSTASDGSLSPTAVVNAAADAGVTCFALSDHDTVAGLDEAASQARARGIRLLPAVELSVSWQRKGLHILGLGVDPASSVLRSGLESQQLRRQQRGEAIAAKLERIGIAGALGKVDAMVNGGQITRTHFARLLVAEGLCKNMKQAFERYLGAGKGAYVGVEWAGLEVVLDWIRAAGGKSVLAHPLHYKLSAAWRERVMTAFKDAGGDAIEVSCGNSTVAEVQLCAVEAQRHGLMGSVGSDFHSPEQRWLGLGRLHPLPATIAPIWQAPGLA